MDVNELQEKHERATALHATAIDFDQLCADGILKKCAKTKYKVLKHDLVPGHVWKQAKGFERSTDGRAVLSFK